MCRSMFLPKNPIFPTNLACFGGTNGLIYPPSPSKIEKCISQHYRHTISPCFHKTNSSMIMQGRVIAIKPHFKPIWGCFGSLLGVCKAQHAFLFLSKLKHTLAYITGQIFFFCLHIKNLSLNMQERVFAIKPHFPSYFSLFWGV